jgi:integrase
MPRKSTTPLKRLVVTYCAHADRYYRRADGTPTGEAANIRSTMRVLLASLGEARSVESLDARALKAWRDEQIQTRDWSHGYTNQQTLRVQRMLRWAVEREIVTAADAASALSVLPLAARESAARKPAEKVVPSIQQIRSLLRLMPEHHRDVVQVMAGTGCRVGEVLTLRRDELHLGREAYALKRQHKNSHRGHTRLIPLVGPALTAIRRALKVSRGDYVFNPLNPRGEKRSRQWLQRAIDDACARAGVPRFTTHGVRHAAARAVRPKAGLTAAAALLGHRSSRTTELYAPVPTAEAFTAARILAGTRPAAS